MCTNYIPYLTTHLHFNNTPTTVQQNYDQYFKVQTIIIMPIG